jgi:hypothetical protein
MAAAPRSTGPPRRARGAPGGPQRSSIPQTPCPAPLTLPRHPPGGRPGRRNNFEPRTPPTGRAREFFAAPAPPNAPSAPAARHASPPPPRARATARPPPADAPPPPRPRHCGRGGGRGPRAGLARARARRRGAGRRRHCRPACRCPSRCPPLPAFMSHAETGMARCRALPIACWRRALAPAPGAEQGPAQARARPRAAGSPRRLKAHRGPGLRV